MHTFPIDKVNKILHEADERFHYVNFGGCGAMAAIIAKCLAPVVPVKIVCYDYNKEQINDLRNNGITRATNSFHHVWVEFLANVWYAVDINGIRSPKKMINHWGTPCKGNLTINELEILVSNHKAWNPMFDRDQIPDMTHFMEQQFSALWGYK